MLNVLEAPRARGPVVDFIGQQLVWWAVVALVLADLAVLAVFPAAAYVVLISWQDGRSAILLAVIGALAGAVVDSALVHCGAIGFPSDPARGWTTPWMIGLWAAFAISFSGSMMWLARREAWAGAVFGAFAGVLAYRGGASLGILTIGDDPLSFLCIAAGWAAAVPLLQLAAKELS